MSPLNGLKIRWNLATICSSLRDLLDQQFKKKEEENNYISRRRTEWLVFAIADQP